MSSLQQKGDAWYCQFTYHGKRHTFTVGKVTPDEAETKAGQVEYLLVRLKQGLLRLPPGMDIVTFIEFDGKPPEEAPDPKSITLKKLTEKYLSTHEGSLKQPTLDGIETHFKHLAGTLGEGFPVQEMTMAELQRHVDRRAKQKGAAGQTLAGHNLKRNRHSAYRVELGRPNGIPRRTIPE